ncbi:hypothetical protein RchiOBHm_Chr7g0182021 [Rosa chinensis]|uniref:Uncharacterized protein n=1 Tax=Rosa chinensis TaxID=74649 RepID=A0A2P6P2S5_ROSCH|nr:hypothetical protein RchiOBHm_Chr7g0182021 [Rosa chinensis]
MPKKAEESCSALTQTKNLAGKLAPNQQCHQQTMHNPTSRKLTAAAYHCNSCTTFCIDRNGASNFFIGQHLLLDQLFFGKCSNIDSLFVEQSTMIISSFVLDDLQ